MVEEVKTQVKVGVGVEALWRAMAKDMRFIITKIVSNLVEKVEVIEGDGRLGTILLFTFGPGVPAMRYQKEKIVELDEFMHRIGLQVIEGGHLNHGFSSYKTTFRLTATGEQETLVDVAVAYELADEKKDADMPSNTTKSSLAFIKHLENYMLNGSS